MTIYQDAAGKWVFFDGAAKHRFDSEQEAHVFMNKLATAKFLVELVQSMAKVADNAADAIPEYFDVAGAGWTDDDVAALGITAAQLAACVTFIEQIPKLMLGTIAVDGHSDIAPANYRATLNAVRRVQA